MSKFRILISPEKWYYSVFIIIVVGFSLQLFLHNRNQAMDSFDFGIATLADEIWEEIINFEITHHLTKIGPIQWSPKLLKSFQRSIANEFKDETVDSNLKDFGFLRVTNLLDNKILYESPGLRESGLKFREWVNDKWNYKPFKIISNNKTITGIGFLDVHLNNHIFVGTLFENLTIDSVNKDLYKYRKIASIVKKAVKRDGAKLYVEFNRKTKKLLTQNNAWTYVYFYEKDSLICENHEALENPPFLPDSIYDKIFIVTIKDTDGNAYRQRSEFKDYRIDNTYRVDIAIPEKSVLIANMEMGFSIAVGVIILIAIVGIGGHSLKQKAIKPVNDVINIVNELTSKSIDKQIPYENVDEHISRLISTFNDLLNRLALAFKQQKAFIADTSHELRTPLSILSLDISEALKKVDEKSDIAEHLRQAKREIGHLTRIVNDLQWLAKNDAGQLYIEKTNIRLDEVLLESMSRSQVLAKENDIQLIIEEMNIVEYYGDYKLLVHAYSNLVSNAIKYSKAKGIVKLALIIDNPSIIMRVADEGIGIQEDCVPKIFERFYRVDKSRSRETGGSGLGLAIAKHIVELHNGTIKVQSKVDVGSVFEIELPDINNS